MQRRQFTFGSLGLAWGLSVNWGMQAWAADGNSKNYRVGVIGHTGRGNYGHGLDTVWFDVDRTEIVAVADANADGLQRELAKLKLAEDAGYVNYHEMLKTVRPEIVAVCPRQPDQHHAMIMAAIAAGAKGIYVEKPFVRTLKEADEVLAAADKHNVKIAVAHRNRYRSELQTIDQIISTGEIGKLLEIRGRGKCDRRGGAEDLWVLGSHVLNLMAYFGGKPKSCSAVLLQDGQLVTKQDVHDGPEALGLIAGNELHARYLFDTGVVGYYESIANGEIGSHGFGLQLIGSKGVIELRCDETDFAHLVPGNPFEPSQAGRPWLNIRSTGVDRTEPNPEHVTRVQHHQVPCEDLIAAIEEDREPLCSAKEAAQTIEMISAVFESHRQNGRSIAFPLEVRENPLTLLD
ncbi:Gfo/Idh/MocA family oxidoreductase [Rubinisphaera sp.]|uniref:Gfo/Idh/MocA family protein n=1 Tax=Rubinisphaera sp. TaxID=2024857 RepID=UPI0025EBEA84|nr:Gfo/Idh/MocA family oxidoreductase [Rubinisphaera sp.]|tara:strand:+ start:3903 stop:5114 length:1212 start_codon:yes stop_codon:yes gene_type:complete